MELVLSALHYLILLDGPHATEVVGRVGVERLLQPHTAIGVLLFGRVEGFHEAENAEEEILGLDGAPGLAEILGNLPAQITIEINTIPR